MTEKQKIKQIEVLGHQIDLDRIENPHVRRAIRERIDCFIFNYGDSGTKSHTDESGHSDYKTYGDYSERSGHTDINSKSSSGSRHKDYTDSKHEDHTESWNNYDDKHCDARYEDTYDDYRDNVRRKYSDCRH